MTRSEIQRRALDLFATGRYATRRASEEAAIVQISRERVKREQANATTYATAVNSSVFSIPQFGDIATATITITRFD